QVDDDGTRRQRAHAREHAPAREHVDEVLAAALLVQLLELLGPVDAVIVTDERDVRIGAAVGTSPSPVERGQALAARRWPQRRLAREPAPLPGEAIRELTIRRLPNPGRGRSERSVAACRRPRRGHRGGRAAPAKDPTPRSTAWPSHRRWPPRPATRRASLRARAVPLPSAAARARARSSPARLAPGRPPGSRRACACSAPREPPR